MTAPLQDRVAIITGAGQGIGADVATMPPSVIRSLFHHVLTDNGIAAFTKDWESTGQSIG